MAASPDSILRDVNILGELNDSNRHILNKDAAVFLALLHRTFNAQPPCPSPGISLLCQPSSAHPILLPSTMPKTLPTSLGS